MFFSVFLCVLVIVLIPFCSTHLASENRYECGAHGKFEYCIDGIPGCVIGCHCHPGYYFDTDTKICEPNVKLTQEFRRHYNPEPTRVVGVPEYTLTVSTPTPTPTSTDSLDEKVDQIAKDTDDLGDWLYNQFFKTIENQVINNTNNTDTKSNKKPLTRRSGGKSEPTIIKSKRKTRKSMRSSKKKKHTKVHGLRRKLLRITEDDSLFDSESGSDSSSESSSGDSDSDSSADSSGDSASSDGGKKSSSGDDKEHGHKKVIIFNKRPKPPLPSFIFLPSMDTPFYPPIGLPPPPPIPMYPMIPVPPMAPPMYGVPGTQKCDDAESNATTGTDAAVTTTHAPDAASTEATSPASSDGSTEASTPTLLKRRSRLEKLRRGRPSMTPIDQFIARSREPGILAKAKHSQRNKLMQKLRDKMMENRLNNLPPIETPPPDEFPVAGELPLMDVVPISQESLMPFQRKSPPPPPQKNTPEHEPAIPKLEDVDFKYLSELIHRVNQSDKRNRLAPLPFDLNEDIKELQKIQQAQQTRRNYNPYNVEPAKIDNDYDTYQHRQLHRHGSTDDAYYTNLGRQIASMIRNADTKIDQHLHSELEQANRQVPFHSVLNENSPRSYWERSVRSPLTHLGNYNNYLDGKRTFKHSHEKNLFKLENEVEIFASTPTPLSLRELENILNTMEKAHAHIKYTSPLKYTKQSNISLNVNLLPKFIKTENSYRRLFKTPNLVDFVPPAVPPAVPPRKHVETVVPPPKINIENTTNAPVLQEQNRNVAVPLSDYWMFNNRHPNVVPDTPKSKPPMHNSQMFNTNPTKSPLAAAAVSKHNSKKPHKEYLQFLRSMPIVKHTTAKRPEPKFLTSPPIVNYKTLNYFSGKKHHYMFEEASYPLQIPSYKRQIKPSGKSQNPSYFHHELHHFDYFD